MCMCVCLHGMQSRLQCVYTGCKGDLFVPVCVCMRDVAQTTARITPS